MIGLERVKCRHRAAFEVRFLPCNWVVKGFCGIDGRLCSLEEVV